jgi:excisionase family DNA binding protein
MNTALRIEPPEPEPLYVSIKEGAALVRISHWTLRGWLTQGRLRRCKVGGRTLVKREELLSLVCLDTSEHPPRRKGQRATVAKIGARKDVGENGQVNLEAR